MTIATFNPQRDSYLAYLNPNNNFGNEWDMALGLLFSGGSKSTLDHPLINFDVSALAGLYASIDAAELELQCLTVTGDPQAARVVRCTRPSTWTELGATWNKYDGVNAWTEPGGDRDLVTPPFVTFVTPAAPGLLSISGLTGFVLDAIANRSSIVSLLLTMQDEGDDGISRYTTYASDEHSSQPSPLLRVAYTPLTGSTPAAGREAGERELAFDNLRGARPARGARGSRGVRPVVPQGGIA